MRTAVICLTLLTAFWNGTAWSQPQSDEDQIKQWYQQFLHRPATNFELSLHLNNMQFFGQKLEDIESYILGGAEFYNLSKNDHETFIKNLFQVTSLPTPSKRDVDDWHDVFDTFRGDRVSFVKKFLKDTERLRQQTQAPPTISGLSADFNQYLGRQPRQTERQMLAKFITDGFKTNQIRAAVLGSQEYFRNVGSDNQLFIEELYRDHSLPRPSRLEMAQWTTQLNQPGQSRVHVAFDFLETKVPKTGPQFPVINTPTVIDSKKLVADWYQKFLNRKQTQFEETGIQFAIQNGQPLESVRESLLGGPEYYRLNSSNNVDWLNAVYKDLGLAAPTFQERSTKLNQLIAVFNSDRQKLVASIVKEKRVPLVTTPKQPDPKTTPTTTAQKLVQVGQWHREYLQREMTNFEKTGFEAAINVGYTLEMAQLDLLSGQEFFRNSGDTNAGFVRTLHRIITGKNASNAEQQRFLADLTRRGQTRHGFVRQFLATEGKDHDHDHDHDHDEDQKKCVKDTFTARNGTSLRAHTMDQGSGWQIAKGAPRIVQNRAVFSGVSERILGQTRISDGVLKCRIRFLSGRRNQSQMAVVGFRMQDLNNHWRLQIHQNEGRVRVMKTVNGKHFQVAEVQATVLYDFDYDIEIHLTESNIQVKSPWTFPPINDPVFKTQTGIGLWTTGSSPQLSVAFDNFEFCPNKSNQKRGGFPGFP